MTSDSENWDLGRYEWKYCVPVAMRDEVLAAAEGHVMADPHGTPLGACLPAFLRARLGDATGYAVHSTYFDTPDLADYWPLDEEPGNGFFRALWPLLAGESTPAAAFVQQDHSLLSRDLRILAGADDDPAFEDLRQRLDVVVGDPAAARFHEPFERAWSDATLERAQRVAVLLACRRLIHRCAQERGASVAVIDLGTEMSPLTRAGLLAADASVVVTSPTPGSRRALDTLERLLPRWRERWAELTEVGKLGAGIGDPLGAVDIDMRPDDFGPPPRCLARLRFLGSLGALSRESGKPIFLLTPSDGAMGGYAAAVFDARRELRDLAREIARRADVALPSSDDPQPREEKP